MKTVSNVYLIGFAITICIVATTANGTSDLRGKPRTIRGFKNAALSTARGFGKRDGYYQTLDSVNSFVDDPRRGSMEDVYKDPLETESFPAEWLAEELARNPRLARLIVKKFIDQNRDGELSADELSRNMGY